MIKYIHAKTPDAGAADMSARIAEALNAGRQVLWLICGGSNVPVSAMILNAIKIDVGPDALKLLTIGQTDERYGPVGHPDSNWQQMTEAGFDFKAVSRALPMLIGKPLEETAEHYIQTIGPVLDTVEAVGGLIIALFGIGPDGHIAGMIPHSLAISSADLVFGYKTEKFTRLTLTPPALRRIAVGYMLAFNETKKEALTDLKDKDLSLDDEPAQILKSLPEAYVYSDQI